MMDVFSKIYFLFFFFVILAFPADYTNGGDDTQTSLAKTVQDHNSTAVARVTQIAEWINALRSGDENSRIKASHALEQLGPRAKDAVPALIRALRDTNEHVRRNAAAALARIGPDSQDAVASLIIALKDDADPDLRHNAAWALGEIGPASEPAVPELASTCSSVALVSPCKIRTRF